MRRAELSPGKKGCLIWCMNGFMEVFICCTSLRTVCCRKDIRVIGIIIKTFLNKKMIKRMKNKVKNKNEMMLKRREK